MGMLNREAILAAQDLKHEDVPVPEWGGTVRVQTLTGAGRDRFAASMVGADGKPDVSHYRHRMLAACIVDEGGSPMFTGDDVDLLAGKSAVALDRLFAVAERLNQIGESAVKEAEKN